MYTASSSAPLLAKIAKRRQGKITKQETPPEHWEPWLTTLFPNVFTAPFAARHVEYWNWLEAIQPEVKPAPFFAIWPRGGAKTTNAEAGTVRLGAKEIRRFCLYVRSVQDKANESIQNIGAMLESKQVEKYYPRLSSRKIGKYGNSKGWRVDMLRCTNGFSVVALGLDAAIRGIKIEEYRPDFIILDDIDDKDDSPETITKKIDRLTTSILPAGSPDCAVLGIQNLMHSRSIFKQIADETAEFLYERQVSGPYPAIEGLEYEQKPDGKGYRITAGAATWEGQNLQICEQQINEWGLTAFLQESQHEVDDIKGGMYDHLEYRHCDWSEVPDLVRIVCFVDPAVTETDQSDAYGIQVDGIASDDTIYRLYSYEARTNPDEVIKRAILKTVELGGDTIGFETDQGGDLWEDIYYRVWDEMIADTDYPTITPETMIPGFIGGRAGSIGSKVHRGQIQLAEYEKGRFIHVRGTHNTLEKSLNRFPKRKPFDLHDATFWSQYELLNNGVVVVMARGKR